MRKNHALAVLALTVSVGLSACGGSGQTGGGQTSGGQTTSGGKAASTETTSHAIGDPAIKSALAVAQTDQSAMPLDAAPSPDGTVVYYITTGDGGSVLSSVPAAGGSPTTLVQGAPLVKPTGVAVATDGSSVFVADQQALQDSVAGSSGGILVVPTTGSPATATLLPGTEGWSPRGLDVVSVAGGGDVVFFTGVNPATGAPGLFGVRSEGGEALPVAEGKEFASPDSVVLTAGGIAFVTDQGSGAGKGKVLRVGNGGVTPVLSGLRLGKPAGLTLVNDDATLLVSSVDAKSLSDQVLFLDVASGKTAAATKVIGANKDSSGGLHRAHAAPVLAWADVSRSGRVYRVDL